MLKPIQKFVRLVSTKKGAKITLGIWLLAVLVFALFTPSASDYKDQAMKQVLMAISRQKLQQI